MRWNDEPHPGERHRIVIDSRGRIPALLPWWATTTRRTPLERRSPVERRAHRTIHVWQPGTGQVWMTKAGKILTDHDIQVLADEAERGYDVSQLTERQPQQRRSLRALVRRLLPNTPGGNLIDPLLVGDVPTRRLRVVKIVPPPS